MNTVSIQAKTHHPAGFGALIGQVRSELTRAGRKAFEAHGVGLNYSQIEAVRRLAALGPMSAGELAKSLCYDAGALTRMLDQLEQRGYLERHPHPDDRRALRIVLSRSGSALGEQLIAISEDVLDHALSDLSEEEQRQLADYMRRMLATLRAESAH
jgi:DNA-binding MarR family transcriptional regulator